MLLNDRFVEAQATAFAARVAQEAGGDCAAMVTRAFQLALQRDPTRVGATCSREVARR